MTNNKRQRKTLYVSHAIQGRFLRRVALYWVLYHLVLWHLLFLFDGVLANAQPQSFMDRYSTFFTEHLTLLLCAAFVFPIIFWDMLKLTNRMAGPLVRFERVLKQMTRGDRVEHVKLRKHDMVHEFQDVFNEFIESRNQELEARCDDTPLSAADVSHQDAKEDQPAETCPQVTRELREIQDTVAPLRREADTSAADTVAAILNEAANHNDS